LVIIVHFLAQVNIIYIAVEAEEGFEMTFELMLISLIANSVSVFINVLIHFSW